MNKCAFDDKDFDTADYVGEVRRLPPQNRFIDSDELRVQLGVALLKVEQINSRKDCRHEWPETGDLYEDDACCIKCGRSFLQYIFMECE